MTAIRLSAVLLLASAAWCLAPAPSAAGNPSYCNECVQSCGECTGCRDGGVCQSPSLAPGACRACLHLGHPLTGCPTPGTCTADGICYPKRGTWGKYEGVWNRWPGDSDDPLPERARQLDDTEIPPPPMIDSTIEDKEAPPPVDEDDSEADDDTQPGDGPGVGAPLPRLPPLRPLNSRPPGGRPGAEGEDPPPPLPGFDRPLRGPAPTRREGFSQAPVAPSYQHAVRPAVHKPASDPPPVLPASFRAAVTAGTTGAMPLSAVR